MEDVPDEAVEAPLLGEAEAPEANQEAILKGTRPLTRLVLYFMAIHFLLGFCEMILVAPLIRLFENSLCLFHYNFPAGGVDESLCKIPDIQGPLATIRGWKSMFDTLPVLLVAIPIGKLGDHYGRRKILALALVGVLVSLCEVFAVCAFPNVFSLRLVWLSSIFLLCGGGLNSASAFMWAMASEAIPTERRSHAFYYIFSAFYAAELIGSFIASVTIEISPWIPCGFAIGSVILCLILIFFMPNPQRHPSLAPEDTRENETTSSKDAVNGLLSALSNRNILLIIPVFLVGIFRYTTLNILIQYASFRFHLKISTGATFYTETAIVNIFLFLFLVPQLTSHIRLEYNIRPQVIDLVLVRTSLLLMCIGCLAIGFSQTSKTLPLAVFIFSSGFGSRVSGLALISYWISDESKATIYAAISVLESLGHAIGDPSMQQIFAAALRLDPFWQALPFFVAASFYFLAMASTTLIRMDRKLEETSNR